MIQTLLFLTSLVVSYHAWTPFFAYFPAIKRIEFPFFSSILYYEVEYEVDCCVLFLSLLKHTHFLTQFPLHIYREQFDILFVLCFLIQNKRDGETTGNVLPVLMKKEEIIHFCFTMVKMGT